MKKHIRNGKVTYYGFAKTGAQVQEERKNRAQVIPDKKKEKAKRACRGKETD